MNPHKNKEEGSNPYFVLAHELVHAVQGRLYKDYMGADSSWILEGQADYFAKHILGLVQYGHERSPFTHDFYMGEFNRRYGDHGWKKKDWDRIEQLSDSNLDRDDYFSFHMMIHFLEKTYGIDKYMQWYHKVGSGLSSMMLSYRYTKREKQN